MMDLSFLCAILMFVSLGLISPFVWGLGYVWVDTLLPQRLSYSLLSSVPLALIMAGGAFASYFMLDRRNPPKITLVHVLCGVMAVWITLTTSWAVLPGPAWVKWDPSFKVLVFAIFIPFMFRTRVQIEAFILVFFLSASAHMLPWGIKTLLSGGGYQMSLGLLSSNASMLAESSSLAGVMTMFIPLLLWARNHSILLPAGKLRTAGISGLIVLMIVGNIGTFARTGLVGLGVLGVGMLLRTRRKWLFLFIAGVLGGIAFYVTSSQWTERISTIADFENEGSSLTRLLVWKWTLGFVASHPFGGGFDCFLTNIITIAAPDGTVSVQYGRAFHNIFFAALGEHGYFGLALYATIMACSVWNMQKVIRRCKGQPDLLWAEDLARTAQLSLIIILACGNFVDFSFLFVIWNMVAMMMCLDAYVYRVLDKAKSGAVHPSQIRAGPLPSPRPEDRPIMPQMR